jgi:hypothetical protein
MNLWCLQRLRRCRASSCCSCGTARQLRVKGGLGREHARVRREQQQAAGFEQQAEPWRFGKRIFGMRPVCSKVHNRVAAKGQVGDHWKVRRAINVAHDALTRQILCAVMS